MVRSIARDDWRELYRCNDLLAARAVTTSIAAMEFDVRLRGRDDPHALDHDPLAFRPCDFPGPYIIEVPQQHWGDLAQVLDQIIDEQAEFDALLAARKTQHQ